MAAFNPNVWYVLTNAMKTTNNTLSVAQDTQAAFDANNPESVSFGPLPQSVPDWQQWQIYPVGSAYIMRNRHTGPNAYLSTGLTTRKCENNTCATVPVLTSEIDNESLWQMGAWPWNANIQGAFLYNLGNGTSWRLASMDGVSQPQMGDWDDDGSSWQDFMPSGGFTGRPDATQIAQWASMEAMAGAQHWNVVVHTTFAESDSSAFSSVPDQATALLVQVTNTAQASITPYTPSGGSNPTSVSRSPATSTSTVPSITAATGQDIDPKVVSGTTLGIGVGIGVGVLAILMGLVLLFLRYRRRHMNTVGSKHNPAELGHDAKALVPPSSASTADYSEMASEDLEKGSTFFTYSESHPATELMSEGQRSEIAGHAVVELPGDNTALEMPHPSYSMTEQSTLQPSSNEMPHSSPRNSVST